MSRSRTVRNKIETIPSRVIEKRQTTSTLVEVPNVLVDQIAPVAEGAAVDPAAQLAYEATIRSEYARYTSLLWDQRRESQTQADNLVLTLSSAFLALSAGFIKTVVPFNHLINMPLLFISWGCLVGSVISTLSSFFVSRKSLDEHIDKCSDYFFNRKEDAFKEICARKNTTELFNFTSAILFVVGVASTLIFVGNNLWKEKINMSKSTSNAPIITVPKPQPGHGQTAPSAPVLPKPPSPNPPTGKP